MDLLDIKIFLTICETNSLSQAAKRLDLSPMNVSRRLSSLENELGVRLLQRTTRSVSLTVEGSDFYPYAKTMLEAEEASRNMFSTVLKGASGLIRITAPSGFANRNIIPVVSKLLKDNPKLRIDLQFSENIVDIVSQGIDIAIRLATLRDSNLIAKKVVDNPRILVASPSYLDKYPAPQNLKDLAEHNCLKLTHVPYWFFEKDAQQTSIRVDGSFSSNNIEGLRELCIQGIGIAQLTLLDVKKELDEGTLLEIILDDVECHYLAVWAVLPTNKYIPQRVNLFIRELQASLL